MDDLIYRRDAINVVDERIQTLLKDEVFRQKCGDRDLYGVKKLLQNLPSADVAPVVHGKWIDCICSHCGYEVFPWNCNYYCPNCGARMDGEV